jgi:hypothetical protein
VKVNGLCGLLKEAASYFPEAAGGMRTQGSHGVLGLLDALVNSCGLRQMKVRMTHIFLCVMHKELCSRIKKKNQTRFSSS